MFAHLAVAAVFAGSPAPAVVTQDGAVIDRAVTRAGIVVDADDVTIVNSRINVPGTSAGNGRSALFGVYTTKGHSGTVVRNTFITMGVCAAAGVAGGSGTLVENATITGCGDGVKAAPGSVYRRNIIDVGKPPGRPEHIDGVQGQGVRGVVVDDNLIRVAGKGDRAVFVQSYAAGRDRPTGGWRITRNDLVGGGFGLYVEDGKRGSGFVSDVQASGNRVSGSAYSAYHAEGGTSVR